MDDEWENATFYDDEMVVEKADGTKLKVVQMLDAEGEDTKDPDNMAGLVVENANGTFSVVMFNPPNLTALR